MNASVQRAERIFRCFPGDGNSERGGKVGRAHAPRRASNNLKWNARPTPREHKQLPCLPSFPSLLVELAASSILLLRFKGLSVRFLKVDQNNGSPVIVLKRVASLRLFPPFGIRIRSPHYSTFSELKYSIPEYHFYFIYYVPTKVQ